MTPSEQLRALPIFDGCAPDEVGKLADQLTLATFRRGEPLLRQGEPGEQFVVMLSGSVEVTRATGDGVTTLAVAERGAILGELALVNDRRRSASVVAVDDTVAFVGDRAAFTALLQIEPAHHRLAEFAAQRAAELALPVSTQLADGTSVLIRPLLRSDRSAMEDLIAGQSAESIRRRFFSPGHPGRRVVTHLIEVVELDEM
ncbi:MAG: cyclic nucleotide-binding domain-containing protein, partial [Actinomycetes bacterium]